MNCVQKFLFLFKSKYRRKLWTPSVVIIMALLFSVREVTLSQGGEARCAECFNGECLDGRCVCFPGFSGPSCQRCNGKIKVESESGWISDGVGNYTENIKCTWLLQSARTGSNRSVSPIFLRIEEFATECGWDWLYIYDGDSIFAPLLGVFSGIVVQKGYQALRFPEVVAKSGYALLHFYTDAAYNLTGFNITYRSNSCPSNSTNLECSGNGVCVHGVCTCNAAYTGPACDKIKCWNNCSGNGICDVGGVCHCNPGFRGNDCSREEKEGYWEVPYPNSAYPNGSASHASFIYNNSLWVFGGSFLDEEQLSVLPIYKYDFEENKWEFISAKSDLSPRPVYGHTCILYEGKAYLYGGAHGARFTSREVSKSVWTFDLTNRKWSKTVVQPEKCRRGMCGPLHLVGHTAVVISDKGNKSRHSRMVVISGHSPRYGYVNVVQEFHLGSGNWNIVTTKGYPFRGSFGHSSVWDPLTQKIYVFGGFQISEDSLSAYLSSSLYSYDPSSHTWHVLENGPQGRFLHAGVVHNGLYFLFGGNSHNDTQFSSGSKCFVNDVLVYDISCDSWWIMPIPSKIPADTNRYGHSVVTYNNTIFIYGGFNGIMQNDLIAFKPMTCGLFTNQKECVGGVQYGAKCHWNEVKEICEPFGGLLVSTKDKDSFNGCSRGLAKKLDDTCLSFPTCNACVQSKLDCVWCPNSQCNSNCKGSKRKPIASSEQCGDDDAVCRSHLHNCPLCTSEISCIWGKEDRCIKDPAFRQPADVAVLTENEPIQCEQSCSDYATCTNCTSSHCMWCNNLNTCVDKNAYVTSFPYGECMSWSQQPNSCYVKDAQYISARAQMCDEIASCDVCLSLPSCGWCDDGSGTGKGSCMDGSNRGPISVNNTAPYLNLSKCPWGRWHFTNCPACQCNGHSTCDESYRCKVCQDFTEGEHCEKCIQGYYGKAINGGQCSPCECNGQAEFCHTETGRCFCATKGITGEDCRKCDTQNNYSGDPTNSSCFYELQIDYQFTFNLSKKEDQYFTKISFKNTPNKHDTDTDFHITCSMMAKMNISYIKAGLPEMFVVQEQNCTTFKWRFSKNEYSFGPPDNTTFFVYVYDFQTPLWIQISFSQSARIDLLHFFITFSTCFLVLLVMAAVLWKIKQRYDMYRRRQRLFVEMEQMASRPFAQVFIEVGRVSPLARLSSLRRRRKDAPSPIALEPCQGNRAAVLSLLITLPGSQQFCPPGQSAICIGSALVALGTQPRKVSFEPAGKPEGKGKLRKSLPSHGLNTCI